MAKIISEKPQRLIPKHGILRFLHNFKRDWLLWTMVAVPIVYVFVFNYMPIYGIQIAFKEYSPRKGIVGSDWTGLENFIAFFEYYQWPQLVWNTLAISLRGFFFSNPLTIVAALCIHVYKGEKLKKFTQNVTYMPNFISTVIMVGILNTVLNPVSGFLGVIYRAFGIVGADDIRASKDAFRDLYFWSGEWQGLGWSTILFVSCLSGVPEELHEAAKIDGASRLRRVWAIDIPAIMPTIGLAYILSASSLLSVGHGKIYLMQRDTNLEVSEIISTYVYKYGVRAGNTSFGTAVGILQSVVGLTLTVLANWFSSTITEGEIALF